MLVWTSLGRARLQASLSGASSCGGARSSLARATALLAAVAVLQRERERELGLAHRWARLMDRSTERVAVHLTERFAFNCGRSSGLALKASPSCATRLAFLCQRCWVHDSQHSAF